MPGFDRWEEEEEEQKTMWELHLENVKSKVLITCMFPFPDTSRRPYRNIIDEKDVPFSRVVS